MGLREKISILFAAMLAVIALGGYFGLSVTLRPAFDALEDDASRQDLARVRNGIDATLAVLNNVSIDWGQWDETHKFVRGENPEFDDINIEPASLTALEVNLMAIYDLDKRLHAGMYVDLDSESTLPVNEAILSKESLRMLQDHSTEESVLSGLVQSGVGPLLFYSRPITYSDGSGPMAGTIVVGRALDPTLIADISEAAEVEAELVLVGADDATERSRSTFGGVAQTTTDSHRINEQTIHDITEEAAIILRVSSARDVSKLGRNTMTSVVFLFIGLGGLVVLGLGWVIRNIIIQPIHRLRSTMADVGDNDDASARVEIDRNDEIGDLADSFDCMLDKLEQMKRRNIEQSFEAGMAEVAAGVLHNIRNSLMPIVNNVAMARDTLVRQSNSNVGIALDEIVSEGTCPERRAKLQEFLKSTHERNSLDRVAGVECLDEAIRQLDHATQILLDQERFTHAKPVIEKVSLGELIDSARGMVPGSGGGEILMEVDKNVSDIKVRAHRIGLMQVIGNLIINAVEAISRSENANGRISVSASRHVDGPEETIELKIRDNGVGVAADELDRLFDRGYTTKQDSGGLGLHWSANALAGMGGEISVSSDGVGRGAQFSLMLAAA